MPHDLPAILDGAADVLASEEFHGWLERWAPAAEWGVAIGTALLALATVWLAQQARKEARSVAADVALQREQMDAANRPLVYPFVTHDFAVGKSPYEVDRGQLIPFKNGGPGVAFNVRGTIYKQIVDGSPRLSVEIHGTTLAAGDWADLRLAMPIADGWAGSEGFVIYEDIAWQAWVTHFRFEHEGPTNQLVGYHEPPVAAEGYDPRRRYRDAPRAGGGAE